MPKTGMVYATLPSHWDNPCVFEQDGKYYFALNDLDGPQQVEVSEDFYAMFRTEFGGSDSSAISKTVR